MNRREALKTVGVGAAVAILPTTALAESKKELCGWMVRWNYKKNSDFWHYEFWQENLGYTKETAQRWGELMKQKNEQFEEKHHVQYEIFPVYTKNKGDQNEMG